LNFKRKVENNLKMTQTTLGDLVRRQRKKAGLTQRQLAKAVAFDHTLISKVERGNLLPSPEFIEKYVQVEALHLTAQERRLIYDTYQAARKQRNLLPTSGETITEPLTDHGRGIASQQAPLWRRWRRRWTVTLSVTSMLVIAALLFLLARRRPTELTLTRRQPPNTGNLVIINALQLSPIAPAVGQPVTVVACLENQSTQPIHWLQMEVAVRGPHARALGWRAPQEDFPGVKYVTLQPGQQFIYTRTRSFDLPGDYFAEPVLLNDKGHWGGILP